MVKNVINPTDPASGTFHQLYAKFQVRKAINCSLQKTSLQTSRNDKSMRELEVVEEASDKVYSW
jgi:hypothetical protein